MYKYATHNMDTNKPTKPLAVISGGTGYIGSAIATELRKNGWQTIALSRDTAPTTDVYVCDVTNEKEVHECMTNIVSTYGPLSALIHAASPSLERIPMLSVSTASFDAALNTNVRAAFLLAKEAIPHMQKNAAFIGITTQAIEKDIPQPSGAYLPAKYALRGFLRALAAETGESGIRVYAVSPGFLPGGLNSDLPQTVQEFLARKSDTNAESPKEIAELTVELCTNATQIPSGSTVAFPSRAVSSL